MPPATIHRTTITYTAHTQHQPLSTITVVAVEAIHRENGGRGGNEVKIKNRPIRQTPIMASPRWGLGRCDPITASPKHHNMMIVIWWWVNGVVFHVVVHTYPTNQSHLLPALSSPIPLSCENSTKMPDSRRASRVIYLQPASPPHHTTSHGGETGSLPTLRYRREPTSRVHMLAFPHPAYPVLVIMTRCRCFDRPCALVYFPGVDFGLQSLE